MSMKRLLWLCGIASTAAIQPSAPNAIAAPLRELPWEQVNIIHSTDTHGWHAGHLQEASYSADWGDYISFATHLRKKADDEGKDVILVDTGDRIEGNGLYDASDPKGKYTFDVFKHQTIDVICSGNHELYKTNSSENEYIINVPNYKNSYLASNIDIRRQPDSEDFIPLAPRFKKFTTKNQGIRIMAFGFLYNFKGNSNNTIVQPVEDTIQENWFQDAIRDTEVDLFLVAGHVAIRSLEYDALFKAIRRQRWDLPIAFVGGHTHIRDWKKFDSSAYAIESGRYMETIGFMSINGLNAGGKSKATTPSPSFNRRYIDNNLYSFHHHTGLNKTTFPTELGLNVTKQIRDARKVLNLDHRYGCAPKDLWLSRVKTTSDDSMFKWLGEAVFPDELKDVSNNTSALVLCNTGAMRFDLFKGPFTIDTTFLISPFTSGFRYIRNVKYELAARLLEVLNQGPPAVLGNQPNIAPLRHPAQIAAEQRHMRQSQQRPGISSTTSQRVFETSPNILPGYVTKDDDGDDGDDTIHAPIPFEPNPNCFQAEVNFPKDKTPPDTVDVVYNEFIEAYVIKALQFLGAGEQKNNTLEYYKGKSVTDIITDWVIHHWPCDD